MIWLTVGLVAVAVGGLLGAGYLFGVRLGAVARARLRADQVALQERLVVAETTARGVDREGDPERLRRDFAAMLEPLQRQGLAVTDVRRQVEALGEALAERERSRVEQYERLRGALEPLTTRTLDSEALRGELRRALAPLVQAEREGLALRETVQGLLGPLVERERLGQNLAQLATGSGTRGELPRLLTDIARQGGFATVVLSDEAGLLLAASAGAQGIEVLAGLSSLLLTLADRIAGSGASPPVAVLVRDQEAQVAVHRIFRVDDQRYLLTAIARGREPTSMALDPALQALQEVLAGDAWRTRS